MLLPIRGVTIDPDVQLRAAFDNDRADMFQELYEEGADVPPITVVGPTHILADGHHRIGAQQRMGRTEVEVVQREGGKAEAIAIAVTQNDGGPKPLTRSERNTAVKLLLTAGWSQDRVAKTLGSVSKATISNIGHALALRGEHVKATTSTTGGTPSKAMPVLPPEVHRKLGDTVLTRIASLPEDRIVEVATAVATAGDLTEPEVRAVVREVKAGKDVDTAISVHHHRLTGARYPSTAIDAAKSVLHQITDFFDRTITWNGAPMALRDVCLALAENKGSLSLGTWPEGVANELHKLAVEAEALATRIDIGTDGPVAEVAS